MVKTKGFILRLLGKSISKRKTSTTLVGVGITYFRRIGTRMRIFAHTDIRNIQRIILLRENGYYLLR